MTQREYAGDAYIDYGIIRKEDMVCNLFETSKCDWSLVVHTHSFTAVNVVSFPLGTKMDDARLYVMMRNYGMSVIASPSSF